MKFYCDITLLPDAEANLGFLWQKVFTQIHLALVANKLSDGSSAVAVSFPAYSEGNYPLGNRLRLFAESEKVLEQLDLPEVLSRLSDYCRFTSTKVVPEVDAYVNFRRLQFDTNIERLARRRAKRKSIALEEATKYYAGFEDEQSKLPYIQMRSLSGGKKFRVFIKKVISEKAEDGEFSCYGLSKSATVPWF